MSRHLVLGGVVMHTPDDVLATYTPPKHRMPPATWERIRPLAVECVRKSGYGSVHSTHFALRITGRFIEWSQEQGVPLDPEMIFSPQRIEQFIAEREKHVTEHSQGNYRAALTTVGRASTRRAPFEPERTHYSQHLRVAPPYSDHEMEGYWEAVHHQSTERRARVLRSLLLLAHGAGLKVGEVLAVCADDVYFLSTAPVASIKVPGRIVPVLGQYTETLRALCQGDPEGPLIGHTTPKAKDPLGHLRKGIVIPRYLPPLTASRLRTTWLRDILDNGASLHEAVVAADLKSAKTLEAVARHTRTRWDNDEYLIIASGVVAP